MSLQQAFCFFERTLDSLKSLPIPRKPSDLWSYPTNMHSEKNSEQRYDFYHVYMCVWIMCKFLPSWFAIGIDRDEWYWHCWKEGCGMIIIPLITSILNPFYRLSWPRKPPVDCDIWRYNGSFCTLACKFGLLFAILACNPHAEEFSHVVLRTGLLIVK